MLLCLCSACWFVHGHTGHRESVPPTIVGLVTQRSDDSVKNNPEHLKQLICLTPASGSNADNKMLLTCIMLKVKLTQPSPTQLRPKTQAGNRPPKNTTAVYMYARGHRCFKKSSSMRHAYFEGIRDWHSAVFFTIGYSKGHER